MTIHVQLPSLATACLVALAIIAASAAFAHAAAPGVGEAAACSAGGNTWDDKNGCDNKGCPLAMKHGLPPGEAGDVVERPDGKLFACDGGTGRWHYLKPTRWPGDG